MVSLKELIIEEINLNPQIANNPIAIRANIQDKRKHKIYYYTFKQIYDSIVKK